MSLCNTSPRMNVSTMPTLGPQREPWMVLSPQAIEVANEAQAQELKEARQEIVIGEKLGRTEALKQGVLIQAAA